MKLSKQINRNILETDLRRSAIETIGDIPWGTHFCQFYKTAQDLIDVLVPYFEAGLKDNEFCMWITAEPLDAEEARLALEARVPDIEKYLNSGQIEILPYDQWYLDADGKFDKGRVLSGWVKRLDHALELGYDGLRLTGNTFWLERQDWQDFIDYEVAINDVIGQYRMLAICTYNLNACSAEDVIDVVSTHQFALVRRSGQWKQLKSEKRLEQLAELGEIQGRWRSLIESAASPIVCLSPDHSITEFNPEAERIYGKKRSEVLGEDYFELFLPGGVRGDVAANMEKVFSGEPTRGFENPVITSSGVRVLQWTVGPITGRDGTISGVIKLGQDITERKRIEESLRRTRDYLEKLIRFANAPIIVWNPETMVTQFNNAFEHLTGYQASEVVGHELDMLFPEITRMDSLEKIARTSAGEFWESVEIPIRCKDGSVRIALWNSANIYAEDGGLEATIAQGQDITERKEGEEVLKQQAELIDLSPDAIMVRDIDGTIRFWSRGAESMYGWTREEAIGQISHELLQTKFPESLERIHEQLRQTGRWSGELLHQTVDGREVTVQSWWMARQGAGNGSAEILESNVEITDRKQMENDLRQTRDYLENLFNYANAPIIVWDPDYRITQFNRAFERLTGYQSSEVLGRELSLLFPPETHDESLAEIARASAGEFWESVEIPIRRKDGDIRIALWNSANTYDVAGETLVATIAQGQDITGRKEAEQAVRASAARLEDSNRELEAFNYSVSHDLRAPLRAIDGFSQILLEDYREMLDDEGRRVLDVIRANTQKMGKLIDDLLSLSRLGRQTINPVGIDVERLVRDIFTEQTLSCPDRSIELRLGPLPSAKGDLALVRQVLVNLLANAIKFSADQDIAIVEVEGWRQEGASHYCVRDNGVGFDMKYEDKLFGVFQRLHSEDEFEGTGVGLAIVKRIIQRHGGSVSAEGEIGKGARFCFTLPEEGGLDDGT